MATPPAMTPPPHAPAFLAASGWGGADIRPLAGDASFRRYFRVHTVAGNTAVLMDAPPEHEDVRPFVMIAEHLVARGFAAPKIFACDEVKGLLLLEDFGDDLVGPLLRRNGSLEREIYFTAVSLLDDLNGQEAPAEVSLYSEAIMLREASLFTDWYAPAVDLEVDRAGYVDAWCRTWGDVLEAAGEIRNLVLRDFHADNLVLLDRSGNQRLGLLDFQDALAGHPGYDLVSLLQDARRQVSPVLEEELIAYWLDMNSYWEADEFRAHYEVLGAQRNAKILGIFTRLWKRDGKDTYLKLQPRVWGYLERNLAHPALGPVRAWFDENVPAEKRASAWS